jgi:dTDP-4-amino-4,6-dideoxygalactose transaminase
MTANNAIPFLDLVTPHLELEEELVWVFRGVLETAGFIGGPLVESFEREFAGFCQAQHCVGVASGTDALRFALIAAGVKPGDTVLTVPNTFIATAEAISQAGAQPDFVEIDERTYNMDARKLQEYLETRCVRDPKTGKLLSRARRSPISAVVPVHLYGQPAEMELIWELAQAYNLLVVEDACQAHGAEYFSHKENCWRRVGSMGHAAAFSFYPGKNLGACGEAGAVTTNDPAIAKKVRMLRDHGQSQKYCHEIEGYNGRLDALQAGILQTKLKFLPDWNRKRRANAHRYDELLGSQPGLITTPYEPSRAKSVFHLYVVRVRHRDQLRRHLADAEIATQIHYPTPLHLQKPYASLGYKEGDFPVTERVAAEILSLPMYPHLDVRQQTRIVETIFELLSVRANVTASRPLPQHPSFEIATTPDKIVSPQ